MFAITATDKAGNETTKTVSIGNMDKSAPTIDITGGDRSAATLSFAAAVADGGSGVASVTVTKPGSAAAESLSPDQEGKYTFDAASRGAYTITATDMDLRRCAQRAGSGL